LNNNADANALRWRKKIEGVGSRCGRKREGWMRKKAVGAGISSAYSYKKSSR